MFHVEHEVTSPVARNDDGGVDGVRHFEDCEERSRTKQSELLGDGVASPVARNDASSASVIARTARNEAGRSNLQ